MRQIVIILVLAIVGQGCVSMMSSDLVEAVFAKDSAGFERLLKEGYSVNKRGYRGGTPLFWAAISGEENMVQELISAGADLNKGALSYGNDQPIHVAAREGYADIVRILLDAGVDPNTRNRDGSAPLHLAVEEQHPAVVELLVSRGADVNARDRSGRTPLTYVPPAFSKDPPNERFTAIVKGLIRDGADVNAQASTRGWGWTPLIAAVHQDAVDAAEVLLKAGADPNAKDFHGHTPLVVARQGKENKAMVRLLLKYGARE